MVYYPFVKTTDKMCGLLTRELAKKSVERAVLDSKYVRVNDYNITSAESKNKTMCCF